MTHSDQDLLSELQRDVNDLVSAAESLALSYKKCKNIGIKDHYSFEELVHSVEEWMSRFGLRSLTLQSFRDGARISPPD